MQFPYIHTQSVPSDTWTIDHNLGRYPVSDVNVEIGGVLQKIMPQSVVYTDENQVVISFTNEFIGIARLF